MTAPQEKKVLVVDDEEDVRLFLQTALENAGFCVDAACDGNEALEKVKADPPDCVSLDLVMPRKSGARFLYELRKDNQWRKIPVVVVTAHARDELGKGDLDQILSDRMISGPETYLEKPVTPDSYVKAIMRAMSMEVPVAEESSEAGKMKKEVESMLDYADKDKLEEVLKVLKKN